VYFIFLLLLLFVQLPPPLLVLWHFHLYRELDLYVNLLMHNKCHLHGYDDMITLLQELLVFLCPITNSRGQG
jgi:hypothetical protein